MKSFNGMLVFVIFCLVLAPTAVAIAPNYDALTRCYNAEDGAHTVTTNGVCPDGFDAEGTIGYISQDTLTAGVEISTELYATINYLGTGVGSGGNYIGDVLVGADTRYGPVTALYSCSISGDTFASTNADDSSGICEGQSANVNVLGYIWTSPPVDSTTTTTTTTTVATTTPALLSLVSSPGISGNQLVINHKSCAVLPGSVGGVTTVQNFVCSPKGYWTDSPSVQTKDNSYAGKTAPVLREVFLPDWFLGVLPAGVDRSGCAAPNECWNGTSVVPNQAQATSYDGTVNLPTPMFNYRCIAGEWSNQVRKTTWDNKHIGFCPQDTQRCLVKSGVKADPSGQKHIDNLDKPDAYFDCGAGNKCDQDTPTRVVNRPNSPSCIRSGQFINDNLCGEDGVWTTRTKELALRMQSLAQDISSTKYSLFCDKAVNVFGASNPSAAELLKYADNTACLNEYGTSCINTVCLLQAGTVKVVGITMNVPLKPTDAPSILELIHPEVDAADCVGTDGSVTFDTCPSGDVYFNKDLNLLLYSPEYSAQGSSTLRESIRNLNVDLLAEKAAIVAHVPIPVRSSIGSLNNFTYFTQTDKIDVFYAAKNGNKELFGFVTRDIARVAKIAGTGADIRDAIGVHYAGGIFDICGFVTSFGKTDTCTGSVQCTIASNKDVFITQQKTPGCTVSGSSSGSDQPSSIIQAWRDLTAKLRP